MKKKTMRPKSIKPIPATTHTMNGKPFRILVEDDNSFGNDIRSSEITDRCNKFLDSRGLRNNETFSFGGKRKTREEQK